MQMTPGHTYGQAVAEESQAWRRYTASLKPILAMPPIAWGVFGACMANMVITIVRTGWFPPVLVSLGFIAASLLTVALSYFLSKRHRNHHKQWEAAHQKLISARMDFFHQ